ncbi:MAG TPA: VIT domain-containing protein [Gemmataceae bacterium]
MDDKTPTPNDPTPMQELSDTLRPSVEQVRAAAPPSDAVERSIDRAERLGPPRPRQPRRWRAWSAAAGIAATLLVGYGLWSGQLQKLPERMASNRYGASPAPVPTRELAMKETIPSKPQKKRTTADGTSNTFMPAGNIYFPQTDDLKPEDNGEFTNGPPAMVPGRPGGMPAAGPQPKAAIQETDVGPGSGKGRGAGNGLPPSQPSSATSRPSGDSALPSVNTATGSNGTFAGHRFGEDKDQKDRNAQRNTIMPAGNIYTKEQLDSMSVNAKNADVRKQIDHYRRVESETRRLREEAARGVVDAKVLDAVEKELQTASEQIKALDDQSGKKRGELLDELKSVIRKQELVRIKTERFRQQNARIPGSIPRSELEAATKELRDAEEQLKTVQQKIDNQKPQDKRPQVWHRDASRPTFARVYVGDGNALELVSLHVSVTVEGPRARTVVDHIFRNPHDRLLEGTFEYPLPSGASPSYFAMFLGQTRDTMPVLFNRRGDTAPLPAEALARLTPAELVKRIDTTDWGRLQEARIVSKEKALETYEEVVRGRIDPALLEYAGGNTFSGRVFPIQAKGYNRVILAYEELLPIAQEHMLYRFPLPGRKLNELQFNLQANAAECREPSFLPKDADKEVSSGRITFSRRWKDAKPEGEIVFACTPADPQVQAVSGRQGDNGPRYVYARLCPQLKTVAKDRAFATHAVFLLDTSLSEHPERFAVNMKLLQKILENDSGIKRFNVLTFNVGAAWLDPKDFFDNTAAGREKALKKLDGIVLEGATDICCALDKLATPGFDLAAGTNLNVFLLSDGHITWGEPDVAALVARFEQRCRYTTRFHCYRTGLGEENSELFEALTRQGGGVFQCFGEDDLKAAAQAHRSQCLKVQRVRFVGGPEASDILVSGRRAAVYPGGELVVAARFNGTGRTTVLVEGEFAGQKMVQEFPLEVRSASELAPRAWAEVAVASLLALHDSNLDALVTAYCQQFGIVSRVASFLVLENEADYKRFNLEEERGKTVAGDLSMFLVDAWARLGAGMPAGKAFERFLKQVDKRVNLLNGPNGAHVRQMLGLLKETDFELPVSFVRGDLVYAKNVADYLGERERDRRNVGAYLKEARRRSESDDVDGAVRVLSSVIEEHPGRGDALRLVGYRLLDLQQPAQAARLFSQVQKQRPFEPHSYRDFAHALEQSGQYGLAAVNYEIVLAGTWHNRFRQELKTVAMEEYAHMMQESIRRKAVSPSLANHFGERLEQMARPQPKSDLRVTIAWNTDATDIDLWVIEPDGTKCFYSHNRTRSGGELSQDQTQGYGPERYQIAKAQPGVYTVIVHYFRPNPNLLGGETHVTATVTRFAGTPQETSERHTVILKKHNEQVEVCKMKF